MADFIGSTSAIIQWCVKDDADEYIVMTRAESAFFAEAGAAQALLFCP